jgi:hypothetical protein
MNGFQTHNLSGDCTGSCKFNYHTTTTAQVQLRWKVIVLLILMQFMIITVHKLSFHSNQWKELVCWKFVFCWGSLDGICISCEVPSIADTALGNPFIYFSTLFYILYICMPVITNDSNVILKYFHFVLLVVFFFFILFMLSNGPPSFIYALVSVFQLLTEF